MATDAIGVSLTPSMGLAQTANSLAWPAGGRIQSSPDVAASRAMGGARQQNPGGNDASRAQGRVQSRAHEMDLIREA